MSERYYIRFRGRSSGPFTVEKLHSLARRARFGRHYEVSKDGVKWESAANFPELFFDGLDDEKEPSPNGEVWGPMADPNPKAGGRMRRSSRSQREEFDLSVPLPMPADESQILAEQKPSEQQKRGKQKQHDADDDDAEFEAPGAVSPANVSAARELESRGRPGRLSRKSRGATVDRASGETEPNTTSKDRHEAGRHSKGVQAVTEETTKGREENGVEKKQKQSGGFWGLFRRKQKQDEEVSPHLASLQELSNRLHREKFGLDDLAFIDSRHQEFPITGQDDNGDAILTLGMLTMIAYQTRATDIHIEPKVDGCDARMRVDGTLIPVVHLPKSVSSRVAGVVKVLCEIDFAGARGIQEGNYSATAPDRRTDFRVSFTPSVHGQKLAIRVLDMANTLQSVDDLGAPRLVTSKLQTVMGQQAGMILMCGPTGSGKTTTLYSLIHGIDRKARNVMTIEDPVEYRIEGVTQSSVDAKRGKNFSDMLRALLRQDPDVLLVGEIRDAETAKIAMQATMTGHLVLSTVHAQDTISAIPRLIDLSADPKMVASSLDVVLAQRLVRVLCTHCAVRRRPSKDELRQMGRYARDSIYQSAGCDRCLGTGFFGRRAIFELLATDERLKDVILRTPTPRQLREAVVGSGFQTLREHGHTLVAQGITSLSEIDRVLGA